MEGQDATPFASPGRARQLLEPGTSGRGRSPQRPAQRSRSVRRDDELSSLQLPRPPPGLGMVPPDPVTASTLPANVKQVLLKKTNDFKKL